MATTARMPSRSSSALCKGEEGASQKDRVLAARELLDRGFGTSVKTEVSATATPEMTNALADLTMEQLHALDAIAREMQATAAPKVKPDEGGGSNG